MEEKNSQNLIQRPPVVVIMGHIDHGKSTLLDYIRKANSVDKEAGGITQHISAYEAEVLTGDQKRTITFLDTPGHEAFCSIRQRSSKVADIAVLVVSAEDGVKPQTIEAYKCIQSDSIPFIVALNKIDKAPNNVDKIKQNLAENEIFVEGWGGSIPIVPISAKTGQGVPELLEIILLQSDMEDLKANPKNNGEGFVIESDLNPKQGISATLVIKDGAIQSGMYVACPGAYAPTRIMEDFKGAKILKATFSSPIRITGWSNSPLVGSTFKTFNTKEEASKYSLSISNNREQTEEILENTAVLPIILKADTHGSLEAVIHELNKIGSDKIIAKIVSKGIGSIGESDIKTANIKKDIVVGFNVGIDKNAESLALRENIEHKTFKIIYELVDFVKERMREATPVTMIETTTGEAKILKNFSKTKDLQVIGGRLTTGIIKNNSIVKIFRRDFQIGEGKVKEIQTQKIKTNEVKEGEEFGMMIDSKTEIVPGDILKQISLIKEE